MICFEVAYKFYARNSMDIIESITEFARKFAISFASSVETPNKCGGGHNICKRLDFALLILIKCFLSLLFQSMLDCFVHLHIQKSMLILAVGVCLRIFNGLLSIWLENLSGDWNLFGGFSPFSRKFCLRVAFLI